MKRIVSLLLAVVILSMTAMPVCAAPEIKPEGVVFDAEFYAKAYPDVVAKFGSDPAILYQHYIIAGMKEGRWPCAPAIYMQYKAMLAQGTAPAAVVPSSEVPAAVTPSPAVTTPAATPVATTTTRAITPATAAEIKAGGCVWVDDTGKKYHLDSSCSRMSDPYQVTVKNAEAAGKKPCQRKNCYG